MAFQPDTPYAIYNVQSHNQVVDLSGGSLKEETPILGNPWNSGDNQQWLFVKLPKKLNQYYIQTALGTAYIGYNDSYKVVLGAGETSWVVSKTANGHYNLSPADEVTQAIQLDHPNSQLSLSHKTPGEKKQEWKIQLASA